MVAFNEVLWLVAVVLDALMCEKVNGYCFLTQGISAVLLVADDAEDAAGTPNRFTFHSRDAASCQQICDGCSSVAIQIEGKYGSYNFGFFFDDDPLAVLICLISE